MEAAWLLRLAVAGAVVRGSLSAQPPNVTYIVQEERCDLSVNWLRVEPPNSSCTRQYKVALRVNGNWKEVSEKCLRNPSWTTEISLGEKIDFGVQTSCDQDCQDVPPWNDNETFPVVQNGIAGTGARNITCIWWNRKYMECSWLSGENASPDSPYTMLYKHGSVQKCKNITRNGSLFQCGFDYAIQHAENIVISVRGNSSNIQPVCLILDAINSLVKLHPPRIEYLLKNSSEVFLNWTKPSGLNNLFYEVEITNEQDHNLKPELKPYRDNRARIDVEPDVQQSFRIRVKTEDGLWSDWSEMKVSSEKRLECCNFYPRASTLYILLIILIPLCVALPLVILLIYMKRIKRLILPKIPDPEQILKLMFQEQSETQPTHETVNNEEIHPLTIVDPAGKEK